MSSFYLSKIEIDHEVAFKAGLRDSYDWHQKTWKAFPGKEGEPRDFLTRLDDVDGGFRLLILSQSKPTRPEWCPVDSWNSKSVSDAFFQHSSYRFSLLANPTKKVKSGKDGTLLKNSRRVPLVKREDLLEWLERKASLSGFKVSLKELRTIPKPRQAFLKKGKAGLHTATEFIGILEVTDSEAFRKTACFGVGPAKAFGFGMLCLSPVS